ncbi:MAG: hypothetical protein NTV94_02745 [Planctomycetota bacterium]|nr:hypothetical protein [Planctomycetota bacterium]
MRWTTSHEHAIGPDGSIYTFLPDDSFVRLNPATGTVMNSAGILAPLGSPNLSAKTAVDASGIVYVSNGWASNPADSGRVWAFSADLSQLLFTVNLSRQNNGGPAIASDGTLIICDLTAIRAFRSERTLPCPADFNQDGGVDGQDIEAFFRTWEDGLLQADVNQDGGIDGADVETFILAWEAGGC